MNKYFEIILKEIEEYSEYRSMCGEIRGLSLAHQTVTDLVRKLEKDDDE